MTNNKNKKTIPPKKPKFNPYWIYAGLFLFFIGLNFFGSDALSGENKTSPAQFFQYLKDGDVEKVDIVNRREAKVYLTKEAEDVRLDIFKR